MNMIANMTLDSLVVPFLSTLFLGIATVLAHRLIALAEKKWGWSVSENENKLLDESLERSVLFAETMAHAELKAARPKLSPETKSEKAVEFAIDEIKRLNLPELSKDKVVSLVKAKFGEMSRDDGLPPPPVVPAAPAPVVAPTPAPADKKE